MCEICSKLTTVYFYSLFLIYFTPFSSVSIVNFEQVNVIWDVWF